MSICRTYPSAFSRVVGGGSRISDLVCASMTTLTPVPSRSTTSPQVYRFRFLIFFKFVWNLNPGNQRNLEIWNETKEDKVRQLFSRIKTLWSAAKAATMDRKPAEAKDSSAEIHKRTWSLRVSFLFYFWYKWDEVTPFWKHDPKSFVFASSRVHATRIRSRHCGTSNLSFEYISSTVLLCLICLISICLNFTYFE